MSDVQATQRRSGRAVPPPDDPDPAGPHDPSPLSGAQSRPSCSSSPRSSSAQSTTGSSARRTCRWWPSRSPSSAALAVGQTLIILTAGIDLSVGAVMVFTSIVMAGSAANYGRARVRWRCCRVGGGHARRRAQRPARHPPPSATVHRHPRDTEHLHGPRRCCTRAARRSRARTSRTSCCGPARRSTSARSGSRPASC